LALLALLALLAGCGAKSHSQADSRDDYDKRIWAQRPVVRLAYTVAPDLSTVTGHEAVRFTPDARACELVFRAWPNSPAIAATGGSLTVTGASVEGTPVVPVVQPAGAPPGAPGTLVELKLPQCVEDGQTVRADLDFTVRLGREVDERLGYDRETRTAWFGSAFPMLSWARGRGWTRDPAPGAFGEAATSEDFAVDTLDVTAPSDLAVAGVGTALGTGPGTRPGTTLHRFRATAVRDLTVGVGRYTLTAQESDGVRVHLAAPGTVDAPAWASRLAATIRVLQERYGPFPYADLWVTIAPGRTGGTAFPGGLQFGDDNPRGDSLLVARLVAQQYFGGLVGSNQAHDPWLDEALAAFSEAAVLGQKAVYRLDKVPEVYQGKLGQPMSYWAGVGSADAYRQGVAQQGAAVLSALRTELGPAFDADLRDYLADNAHRIATPADLAAAFDDQPDVVTRLRQAGALTRN
jgi:hypothetical protein